MAEDVGPMEGTSTLLLSFSSTVPRASPAAVTAKEATTDPKDAADGGGAAAAAPAAEGEEPDSPVTATLTISYTLPDGTVVAASEPMVVARESGPKPCMWESPPHAVKVDEAMLRAFAASPRIPVTFTRSSTVVVDAETGEKEPDILYVMELELARVVLGSKRDVVAMLSSFGGASAAMPAAFEGFTMATLMLRLDNGDGDEDAAFTPQGLAKTLAPFAITVGSASRLPDAPATAEQVDAGCDPVSAHFKWAPGMRVMSQTAASTSPWGAPAGYPAMRVRTCAFGRAEIMFGKDMPEGMDLYRLCATTPLVVHVHDRVVEEEPEEIPGAEEAAADEAAAPPAEAGDKEPGVPEADVYGIAKFDLRGICQDHTLTYLQLEANLLPATTIPSGGDLDWKSRPGRFMEAESTLTLTLETSAPLVPPPDVPRPYLRVVFTMQYGNHRLFREILQIVRGTNAAALQLEGSPKHILTTLATFKLSPEQIVDPMFKVLTGYHLIDGDMRQLAVEGTVDCMEAIVEIARRAVGRDGNKILLNTLLTYTTRVYATLGADLWPIKLSAPLTAIMADVKTQSGTRVRPECKEAVRRLTALSDSKWLREAEQGQMFPSDHMLVFVDKKFGAELTVTDLTGKKPRQRGMHRTASAEGSLYATTDATGNDDVGRQRDLHGGEEEGSHRVKLKDDLDDQNPEYLEQLSQRRRLRLRRDIASEEYEHIRELEETVGAEKRRQWQSWNVVRITHEEAAEIAAEDAAAAEEAAEKAAVEAAGRGGKPLHTKDFVWPLARTGDELKLHPMRPSDSRIYELQEPWVENELHPDPLKRPVDPAAGTNRPAFEVAAKCAPTFEPDPAFFASVHFVDDALAQEMKEVRVAEAAAWTNKVVVDDLRVKTLLPQREKPGQTDRYHSLLHTEPKKLGVTGKFVKGAETAAPVSMYLTEAPEMTPFTFRDTDTMTFTAGPNVDFKRFTHTVGKSDLHTLNRGTALQE